MLDSNFWIYQDEGEWIIDVYDYHTDKLKGTVECQSLKEVARALLDVAEDDSTIDIQLGEN